MAARVLYRSLHERTRLLVSGPDCKRFLHGMVTNDIKGLAPGQGCHAAMLTVKGKMLGDLWAYDVSQGEAQAVLLEMEAAAGTQVRDALERHLIMDDAMVADHSAALGELGVYGAGAAAALDRLLGGHTAALKPGQHTVLHLGDAEVRVAGSRELGLPGFHLFAPAAALVAVVGALNEIDGGAGVTALHEGEAEVLRIEAGVPRYGLDMDQERLPIEAGLEDAVSFQKGCYLGQEVIARVSSRGHVNRRLMGVAFPDGAPPPPPGTVLVHETRPSAGTVQSGAVSPLHGPIALAYVHRTLWEPGTVLQVAAGPRQAVVRALPFSAPA